MNDQSSFYVFEEIFQPLGVEFFSGNRVYKIILKDLILDLWRHTS